MWHACARFKVWNGRIAINDMKMRFLAFIKVFVRFRFGEWYEDVFVLNRSIVARSKRDSLRWRLTVRVVITSVIGGSVEMLVVRLSGYSYVF